MPTDIARFVIHPAIGIMRVGNSPDRSYIGPEVPGWRPPADMSFKDERGRILRQAARFRVFGLDADGRVVLEVTDEVAEVEWTVHIANAKAAWYQFQIALDIPEATGEKLPTVSGPTPPPVSCPRRNADVVGDDRERLVIDPGPRSIRGAGVNADGARSEYAFDTGTFCGQRVPLGELRTDENGHLLVLGGFGHSASAPPHAPAYTFGNNDGWHDDTSDGPVEAVVTYGGRRYEAEGAWVACGPPNFAPGLRSIITMYTRVSEAARELAPASTSEVVVFGSDIFPILASHVEHQWVNLGFAREFGWGAPSDFVRPETLRRLADPSDEHRVLRFQVFRRFRHPAYTSMEFNSLPPLYGDGMDVPAKDPRQWLALTAPQYERLRRWAEGDFEGGSPDIDRVAPDPDPSSIALAARPAALDRAALENCLGGPFHPGCELTWPMRHALLYESPFRVRRRRGPEPDWGETLGSATALHPRGPLYASGPGSLTRWMAVPWQTDTSSCLAAYEPQVDEYLPTFWPIRVPNDVLTWEDYQETLTGADPGAALRTRQKWQRPMVGRTLGQSMPYLVVINRFVTDWYRYGVIAPRPGDEARDLPPLLWVETDRDPGLDDGATAPVGGAGTPEGGVTTPALRSDRAGVDQAAMPHANPRLMR